MRKPVVDGVVAHWLGAYAVLEHTPMGEEGLGERRLRCGMFKDVEAGEE